MGLTGSLLILVLVCALVRFWPITVAKSGTSAGSAETRTGAATLILTLLCVLTAALIAHSTQLEPGWRLLLVAGLLVLALFASSDQWTRVPLRAVGAAGLAIVLALLIRTGQDATRRAEADQAMTELAGVTTSLTSLEVTARERQAGLDAQQRSTLAALRSAAGATPATEPTLTDATSIMTLLADPQATSDQLTKALADFDANHPTDKLSKAGSKLRTDAKAAVDAAVLARTPVTDSDVRAAIIDACVTARTDSTLTKPECSGTATGEPLAVQMAVVRLRLATYLNDLLARPDDKSAVTQAQAALTTARADPGQGQSATPITVAQAVAAGANDMVDEVFGTPPVELGWLIWLLIGLAALATWRQVERRSARQEPGPVALKFTDASGSEEKVERKQLFRTALLTNLKEPAAVPGATQSTALSDLAELALGSDTLPAKVLAALKSIVAEEHGCIVDAQEIPDPDASGAYRVLVRISERDTGRQIAVRTVRGKDAAAAARGAGFWAAATVLGRSTRIPSWAAWSAESYEALAGWDEIADTEQPSDEELATLRRAVGREPTSGLLLHKLADAQNLAGNHTEALELYARAVAAHPQYLIGRYRLAVAVATVAMDADRLWLVQPTSTRLRIGSDVERACRAIGLDPVPPAELTAGGSAELRSLAIRLYKNLIDDLGWRPGLTRLLRRSERQQAMVDVGQVLTRYGWRERRRWMARAGRAIVDDAPPTPVSEVEERAADPRSWWQLSYNLACYYARPRWGQTEPQNVARAIDWLETALNRPGSGQMAGPWLRIDPDLAALRGDPRFQALVATLNPGAEEAST